MDILSNIIKANITEEFKKDYMNLPTEVVWQSPGKHKFVSVLRRGTNEHNYWYYAQRKGQNSVAFLLLDNSKPKPFLCLKQYNGAHNMFTTGAFTGSIDKNVSVTQIVIEEVKEEAGYVVDESRVKHLTSDVIGSSNDETVHMFIVDIKGLAQEEMEPENIWEANTERLWLSALELANGNEIKAKSIVLAYTLNKQ